MINFFEISERKGKEGFSDTIIIDGYSTAKTIKGVVGDIKRKLANTKGLEEFANWYDGQAEELLLDAKDSSGGFFLEIEEVDGASALNEETNEIEYADGNFYFSTRVVR